jgi:DNA-binding transcriptional MerR regulator
MATHLPQRRASQKPEIPDKLYFRIGEVARLCTVEPYVLRFWESEFSQLRPNKSGTGQRLYRKRDVEMALRIKRLLYDEGYTIAGARQVFQVQARNSRAGQPELPLGQQQAAERAQLRLQKARKELKEILGMLSAPIGRSSLAIQTPASPSGKDKKSLRAPSAGPDLFED